MPTPLEELARRIAPCLQKAGEMREQWGGTLTERFLRALAEIGYEVRPASLPKERITVGDLRRVATFMSEKLGLHSAAGKLLARASRMEEASALRSRAATEKG